MKKIISAILVCFVLVGSMLALVSCNSGGIANGTYVYEHQYGKSTLKIKGDTLTVVSVNPEDENEVVEIVCNYTLSEDEKQITIVPTEAKYDGSDEDAKEAIDEINAAIEALKELEGTAYDTALKALAQMIGIGSGDFEKTENGFKLGLIEYTKQ